MGKPPDRRSAPVPVTARCVPPQEQRFAKPKPSHAFEGYPDSTYREPQSIQWEMHLMWRQVGALLDFGAVATPAPWMRASARTDSLENHGLAPHGPVAGFCPAGTRFALQIHGRTTPVRIRGAFDESADVVRRGTRGRLTLAGMHNLTFDSAGNTGQGRSDCGIGSARHRQS
jgi:hypothetical protein